MKSFINVVKPASMLAAVFVLALATSVAAAPQRGGGGGRSGGGPRGHIIVGGGFYAPFWGSYYGYGYPYGYPYWAYNDSPREGSVKTEITPKDTQVYVDGYYAGVADDFDGAFRRLHTSPGGHAITLHLEGYQTVTRNLYLRPDSTVKVKETMEKLAPGEVSQPVPAPPARPSRGVKPPSDDGSAPQQ